MQVVDGAMLMCSFGAAPGTLGVLPTGKVNSSGKPAATIMDSKPMVNIKPFGMCQSPSNPQVAAATSAAMGVLTPMPCVPMTMAPWVPTDPTVMIGNMVALNDGCQLLCMWAGQITVKMAGQFKQKNP